MIADSSSFFGELSAPEGALLAPAPPDTAIVEGFDVNVKVPYNDILIVRRCQSSVEEDIFLR